MVPLEQEQHQVLLTQVVAAVVQHTQSTSTLREQTERVVL